MQHTAKKQFTNSLLSRATCLEGFKVLQAALLQHRAAQPSATLDSARCLTIHAAPNTIADLYNGCPSAVRTDHTGQPAPPEL
jgi:hypothetical protein